MIRRPPVFAAAGFAAAVISGYYAGIFALSLPAGGIAAFLILRKQMETGENIRTGALLLLVFYGFGLTCFCINDSRLERERAAFEELAGEAGTAEIEGTVMERSHRISSAGEKYIQITLECSEGRCLIKFYEPGRHEKRDLIPGREINVRGRLQPPQGRRNPGCFDYALYLKSGGVTATMTGDSFEMTEDGGTSLRGSLFLWREHYIRTVTGHTDGDTASMLRAIMFGDKGEMDQDMLELFRRNGTAHILAVSGLHIGIIYGFLVLIWRWKKGWIFFFFIAAFFTGYAVLAGFSPSVMRAVLMVLLHSFAFLTGRRYDLSNAAFLVAVAAMIRNPFMLFNAGFQMSFLAVLTMALVLPFLRHVYSGVFLSGLAIQIGLGPFILYNFNYLSLIAVLINVPVIFLAGIIVPLGLVNMLPVIPGAFFRAEGGLCSILRWMNRVAEIDGITTFQVSSPPVWVMAFYYLALLMMATEEGRLAIMRSHAKARHIVKLCLLVLALSLSFSHLVDDGFRNCDITFVDVGQGDCMHLRSGGRNYLVDGGGSDNYNVGKQVLRHYLLKNGASHIDGAFVTHLHTDHYRGICELAHEGLVDKLYVYEGNRLSVKEIEEETGLDSDKIVFLHAGQRVELGRNEYIEILYPERKTDSEYGRMKGDEENENAVSLIMRIDMEGISTLVTGDIDEEGERELISRCRNSLKSDILKIPHHGSKYSSSDAFLDVVSPDFAVVQVGKNNYGHPAPEVLEKLAAGGVAVYRNDLQGAVGVEIKKGEVRKIRRMIE
ncbi:MAG: DNA internalization-related competence protein ComEC/Rec2 [Bacillota bacterium]|nr:DNA internalization-related competence protein ComEC/Rec2 [Bacillota bacterium]